MFSGNDEIKNELSIFHKIPKIPVWPWPIFDFLSTGRRGGRGSQNCENSLLTQTFRIRSRQEDNPDQRNKKSCARYEFSAGKTLNA